MVNIIEELGKKQPRYSMKHRKLIESLARKGAIDYHEKGEKSYDLGKFFNNFYEFYIYASYMGVYLDNPVPLSKDFKNDTFSVPMRDWTSNESAQIVQYLWMTVMVKMKVDLNALEEMDDKGVEREMRRLKDGIEAYANGGFEFINSKVEENPAFFDDDDCFVKLLKEVE